MIFIGIYEMLLRQANMPNIYSFKNELIDKAYEGIVLGNSHALRGIIAENLNYNTISLANVSQSIIVDKLWMEEVLERQQLKFIILNFSVATFTGNIYTSKESWRIKDYNIYTSLQLDYSPQYNFELLNGLEEDKLQKVKDYLNGDIFIETNFLSKGSNPTDIYRSNFEEDAITTSKRHTAKLNHIESNKKILNTIIALSKKNNFKIIMVTPPSHNSYRKLIPQSLKEDMFKFLNHVDSHHDNLYWFNYFESDRFKDEHFKDSDHLNLNGAQLFTEIINLHLKDILN